MYPKMKLNCGRFINSSDLNNKANSYVKIAMMNN